MNDRTQDLIERARAWEENDGRGLFAALADALERYQRRVVAHHDISTLSEEVLKEYDYRSCPICARADTEMV